MIFRDCLTSAHWCFSTLSNTLSRIFNRHVERLLIAFPTELVYYSVQYADTNEVDFIPSSCYID